MRPSKLTKRFNTQPSRPIRLAIQLNQPATSNTPDSPYTPNKTSPFSPFNFQPYNQPPASSPLAIITRKQSTSTSPSFTPAYKELRTNSYASTKASEINTPANAYIKSNFSKKSSLVLSREYQRKKTNGSLSSILSLAKQPSKQEAIEKTRGNGEKSPEQQVIQEKKQKEFRSMVGRVFQPNSSPSIEIQHPSIPLHESYSPILKRQGPYDFYISTPKSMVTPKEFRVRPQTSVASNSPYRSPSNFNINSRAQSINAFGDTFSVEESPNDSKTKIRMTSSAKKSPTITEKSRFFDQQQTFSQSKFIENPSLIRPNTGTTNSPTSKFTRPSTAQKSTITTSTRPGTANLYSKVNTGLNRDKGYKLSGDQRYRLDTYMETDFNEDLIYTESYLDLERYKEKGFNNLEEVKEYLTGKQVVGVNLDEMIEEYKEEKKKKIEAEQQAASIAGNISSKNLENLSLNDDYIPMSTQGDNPMIREHENYTVDSYAYDEVSRKTPISDAKSTSTKRKEVLKRQLSRNGKIKLRSLKSVNFLETRIKGEDGLYYTTTTRDLSIEHGTKREKIKKIRKGLLQYLSLIHSQGLTIKQVMDRGIQPLKPYQRKDAKAFIAAAKAGNRDIVKEFLVRDSAYAFECDPSQHTALHWAAKRGHASICELLIEYKASLERIDLTSKTPLYYALREGNSEIVRMLLFAKANPWSTKTTSYRGICDDQKSLRFLMKARQLDFITAALQKLEENVSLWQRKATNFLGPSGIDTMTTIDFDGIVEDAVNDGNTEE